MRIFLYLILPVFVLSCQYFTPASEAARQEDNPQLASPFACDTCKYPVVMVHGFLASGDTYAPFHQLFTSNAYKPGQLFVFDWNTLNQGSGNVAALDALIDNVLAQTSSDKVALMGHSAGGGLCYNYLSDPARAAKVVHYVHLGSNPQNGPAGPGGSVPTMNIWSPDDAIVQGGDIPGASNVELPGKDHYEVATSKESFAAIYQFFHGAPPATLDVTPESPVCIAGRALTFGENQPLANAQVDIYELDAATGQRISNTPFQTWHTNTLGYWGPLNVEPLVNYEFVVTPANGGRVIHYFREGFIHLNTLVYLRTLPPPTSPAGLLLAGLPNTPGQSVLNVFSASSAVIHPQDTLYINDDLVSTAQFATADKTAIAWFFYDDGDSNTELNSVGLFGLFPFLNGIDYYFQTATPATIQIELNGRVLRVPNRKSSEGILVAVFD